MRKTIELKRVVVTGLGMVTSLGLDVQSTWKAMVAGKSGIDQITQWGDLDDIKEKYKLSADFPLIAGEVKQFDIKEIVKQRKQGFTKEDLKQIKYMDPFIQYSYAATLEAIADANVNLDDGEIDPYRIGVIIGSGLGGPKSWENEFHRFITGKRVSPFLIPRLIPNLAAGNVSISFKAKGANADQMRQITPGPSISAKTSSSPSLRMMPLPSPLAAQLTYVPDNSSYLLRLS